MEFTHRIYYNFKSKNKNKHLNYKNNEWEKNLLSLIFNKIGALLK